MGEAKEKKKAAAQTFSVKVSERERFSLATLLLKSVEIKGEADRRRFNRCFEALGMDDLLEKVEAGRPLTDEQAGDKGHSYDLTVENHEFLNKVIEVVGLSGLGARRIGLLLERIAAAAKPAE
jgi:hypothetical protein